MNKKKMNELALGISEIILGVLTVVYLTLYWRSTTPTTFYLLFVLAILWITFGILTLTII
jgi:tryptophan-rich sensory protein